jgi:hypothetical protein
MHSVVIIPYRPQASHDILVWTLDGYAGQKLEPGHTMEVRVGVDGAEEPLDTAGIERSTPSIVVHKYPLIGAAAVRNRLAREVPDFTTLLIFGNADARPEPTMVQQHAYTMANLPSHSLVLGAAPWERISPTVIDAMIDQTPMIFSYCQATPRTWYNFRIAYSLNLSVRYEDFVSCGGFHDLIRPYYYEDLAFGCRVLGPERKGLFFEPDARVLHRHPMTFDQYLDREELLGMMAPVLSKICPEAFTVLMGGRSAEEIAEDFRRKLAGDPGVYRRIYQRLRDNLAQPADTLGTGKARQRAIDALFQLHIPVKLLVFRVGFVHGMELVDDSHWPQRRPQGLWHKLLQLPNKQYV